MLSITQFTDKIVDVNDRHLDRKQKNDLTTYSRTKFFPRNARNTPISCYVTFKPGLNIQTRVIRGPGRVGSDRETEKYTG